MKIKLISLICVLLMVPLINGITVVDVGTVTGGTVNLSDYATLIYLTSNYYNASYIGLNYYNKTYIDSNYFNKTITNSTGLIGLECTDGEVMAYDFALGVWECADNGVQTETDPIWTSDKSNYYNKTEIDGFEYTTNESALAYVNSSGYVINWSNVITSDPAGSDTEIQFNDGGSFGSTSNFTFNSSNYNAVESNEGSFSTNYPEDIISMMTIGSYDINEVAAQKTTFYTDDTSPITDGVSVGDTLVWTSGSNAGESQDISALLNLGGRALIILATSPSNNLAVNDQFDIISNMLEEPYTILFESPSTSSTGGSSGLGFTAIAYNTDVVGTGSNQVPEGNYSYGEYGILFKLGQDNEGLIQFVRTATNNDPSFGNKDSFTFYYNRYVNSGTGGTSHKIFKVNQNDISAGLGKFKDGIRVTNGNVELSGGDLFVKGIRGYNAETFNINNVQRLQVSNQISNVLSPLSATKIIDTDYFIANDPIDYFASGYFNKDDNDALPFTGFHSFYARPGALSDTGTYTIPEINGYTVTNYFIASTGVSITDLIGFNAEFDDTNDAVNSIDNVYGLRVRDSIDSVLGANKYGVSIESDTTGYWAGTGKEFHSYYDGTDANLDTISGDINLNPAGNINIVDTQKMVFDEGIGEIYSDTSSFIINASSAIVLYQDTYMPNDISWYFGDSGDGRLYSDASNFIIETFNGADINLTPEGKVQVNSDLNMTGNFTGNIIRGLLYIRNESNDDTVIASGGTYYNISEDVKSGHLNGFTFDGNNSLTAQVSGWYDIDYSIGFSQATGAGDEWHFSVGVNGVPQDTCHMPRKINTITDFGSASCSGETYLNVGDKVTPMVENENDADDANIMDMQLRIRRVGQ